ncbi:MAG: hypothetical protein LBJ00_16960 [Planctomycetaceae bacterium]|jgi:hypothetical protein|nr:hypothetical protein [Planctomycetaceae bacterium]
MSKKLICKPHFHLIFFNKTTSVANESPAHPTSLPHWNIYTQATLKFMELNTQAQQREAVVHGRSLPPILAAVY